MLVRHDVISATLAAALIYEGVLDESKAFAHYLPELRGSAFEEATLRQAMDMQTGLQRQRGL